MSSSSESNTSFNYDVIRDNTFIGHRFTKDEVEKMKEGVEIDDSENIDDEIKESIEQEQEENEKKEFMENLIRSPYPLSEGKFADAVMFEDRCRLMKPLGKGKVFKYVIRPGNGRQVTSQDAVLFHLNAFIAGTCEDPFDSTYARKKPLLAKINRLLDGYAVALISMKVGEMSEFAIDSSFGYGELGCPPRIPAKADIIVIIEVLDLYVKGSIQYYHSLSTFEQDEALTQEQVLEFAQQDRKTGSDFYRDKNYRQAVFYYRRAIDLLERNFADQSVVEECNSILLTLYHNAANCQIQLSHGPSIVNYAKRALRIDSESVKANYQLGKGYLKLGKFKKAEFFLTKAHKSRPNDQDINRELEVLNHKMAVESMDSKALYKQMAKAIIQEEEKSVKSSASGSGSNAGQPDNKSEASGTIPVDATL